MNSYLVVDLPDRMLLIDQHALHEIILFEEIYRRLVDGVMEKQRLLVPDVVLLPMEYLPLVDRASTLLQKFGFEMEAFGPDSVAFHAIPSIFDREAGRTDLAGMVCSVLESLQDGFVKTSAGRVAREREMPLGVDAQLRDIGATIACKRAVKAGMPLSQEEMQSLLARASSAIDPRHCPHGRPTVVSYSRQEIEKMFDRR
jgi:DNA mismatch repair protein MutL